MRVTCGFDSNQINSPEPASAITQRFLKLPPPCLDLKRKPSFVASRRTTGADDDADDALLPAAAAEELPALVPDDNDAESSAADAAARFDVPVGATSVFAFASRRRLASCYQKDASRGEGEGWRGGGLAVWP